MIQTFEIITVIDLKKLIDILRGKEKNPYEISNYDPLNDEKELDETYK